MAAIIVAAAVTYVVGGWSVSLWDRDEPWYCQASKQMVESGNWVTMHFLDQPRYAKPVFIYWCHATSMTLFGVNQFSARLVSAVAMTLTLVVISIVLSRAIGLARAALTVLVFATSGMVIASAKMCLTDSVLLVFITGMQLCLFRIYWMARRRPGESTLMLAMVLWVCMGFAALTKGPSAFVLMLASMGLLAVMDVAPRFTSGRAWLKAITWWREVRFIRGMAIVLVIGLPWLLTAYYRDPEFVRNMLLEPGKHLGSNQDGHSMYPGYYLLSIWITFFPWSIFLPTTLVLAFRHLRVPHVRFALAIIISNWLFQEIMVTKLPHYLMPSFLSLAFLTSTALIRCHRRQHDDLHRSLFLLAVGIWGVGSVIGAVLPTLGAVKFQESSFSGPVLFGIVGLAYTAASVALLVRRRLFAASSVMGGGMLVLIAVLYLFCFPHTQYLRLPQRVGEFLRSQNAVSLNQVIMTGYNEPSLAFYQGGTIRFREKNFLARTDPGEWPEWIVISAKLFQTLGPERQRHLERVASFTGVNYNTGGDMVELLVMRKRPLAG